LLGDEVEKRKIKKISSNLMVTIGLMLKGSGVVITSSLGGAISADFIILIFKTLRIRGREFFIIRGE